MSIRDIEDEVADKVTAGWAAQVDDARRALIALWSARGENLTPGEVEAILRKLKPPKGVDPKKLLLPAAAYGNEAVPGKTVTHLSDKAVAALDGVEKKATVGVADVRKRLKVADLAALGGVLATVAPLVTSVAQMRAAASWATNTAANEATVSAAAQVDAKLVFVPERDACLECTGYAGETPGPTPPIHPHCRCELHVFEDPDVPLTLKREAVRSVLRGFSLPSESQAARLRAARALLKTNPVAPESVKAYARQAVKGGKFPKGRSVP